MFVIHRILGRSLRYPVLLQSVPGFPYAAVDVVVAAVVVAAAWELSRTSDFVSHSHQAA